VPKIEANGLSIEYQWQGRRDGPLLILINGMLTDLASWAGHLPAYVDHFHVLTYDCRGQGGTDKPEEGPYTPAMHAADLRGLMTALGLERGALLGVSNGASAALQFAVDSPAQVTAMVLANGYGRADTMMKVKLNSWLAGMAAGGGPLRFDVATPWVWGATFLNNHFEALKPFREKGATLPVHAVRNLIEGGMHLDVLEQAANIICPTLLLTGDEDLLTPLSYSHELQRRIADSRIVMLERAGHAMFLEQPGRFTQVAGAFLREALRVE
jgi:3-oxoadipate enol-lactonase